MTLPNGMTEMDTREMSDIDGGWVGVAVGIVVAVALTALSSEDSLKEGYEDGYAATAPS